MNQGQDVEDPGGNLNSQQPTHDSAKLQESKMEAENRAVESGIDNDGCTAGTGVHAAGMNQDSSTLAGQSDASRTAATRLSDILQAECNFEDVQLLLGATSGNVETALNMYYDGQLPRLRKEKTNGDNEHELPVPEGSMRPVGTNMTNPAPETIDLMGDEDEDVNASIAPAAKRPRISGATGRSSISKPPTPKKASKSGATKRNGGANAAPVQQKSITSFFSKTPSHPAPSLVGKRADKEPTSTAGTIAVDKGMKQPHTSALELPSPEQAGKVANIDSLQRLSPPATPPSTARVNNLGTLNASPSSTPTYSAGLPGPRSRRANLLEAAFALSPTNQTSTDFMNHVPENNNQPQAEVAQSAVLASDQRTHAAVELSKQLDTIEEQAAPTNAVTAQHVTDMTPQHTVAQPTSPIASFFKPRTSKPAARHAPSSTSQQPHTSPHPCQHVPSSNTAAAPGPPSTSGNTDGRTSQAKPNSLQLHRQQPAGLQQTGKRFTPTAVGLSIQQYDPVAHACWTAGSPAPFMHLANTFAVIDATTKRLEIANALTNMFRSLVALSPADVLPCIYLCTGRIGAAHEPGGEMHIGGATVTAALREVTGVSRARLGQLYAQLGDLGDVAQACKRTQVTLKAPAPLTLTGLMTSLRGMATDTGSGSSQRRQRTVVGLLRSTRSDVEVKFLVRFLVQNLRVGANWKSVVGPLAKAVTIQREGITKVNKARLDAAARDASEVYHLCPSWDVVVPTLLEGGIEQLKQKCTMVPGVPVKPQLARICEGVLDALKILGPGSFLAEYKYDGRRAQIHLLSDGQVKIFSRNSEDSTAAFPDVVQLVREAAGVAIPLQTAKSNLIPNRSIGHAGSVAPVSTLLKSAEQADGTVEGNSVVQPNVHPQQTNSKSSEQSVVDVLEHHQQDDMVKAEQDTGSVSPVPTLQNTKPCVVLDAEIVGVERDNVTGKISRFLAFQELATRARGEVSAHQVTMPVCVFVFDLLHVNGQTLLGWPLRERLALLPTALPHMKKGFMEMAQHTEILLDVSSTDADVDPGEADMLNETVTVQANGTDVFVVAKDGKPDGRIATGNATDAQAGDEGLDVVAVADVGPAAPQQAAAGTSQSPAPSKVITVRSLAVAEQLLMDLMQKAHEAGTEGLMLKRLDGPAATYEPSKRSDAWIKLKRDYCEGLRDSLDLVVIGAWQGNGRKVAWLSPFLLAAWDPLTEQLQSVCRCMSGFTDAFYAEATARLKATAIPGPKPYYNTAEQCDYWFEPKEVWEIRGAELSLSPVHKAGVGKIAGSDRGLALRFPRFIRIRDDKGIEDATSPEMLIKMYLSQQRRVMA